MRRGWRAGLLLVLACGPVKEERQAPWVSGAFLFAPLPDSDASGYGTVHNPAGAPDTLVAVEAAWATAVMLHEQIAREGLVSMEHRDRLVVPARDSVRLAPGGTHLMFSGLHQVPVVGDSVSVTLRFARAGSLVIQMVVRGYGDEPPS